MKQDKKDFLMLATLPARLSITETAWLLGFSEHDISALVSSGLLKPLGRPPPSGSKFFSTAEVQGLREDTRWLAKASDTIVSRWKSKNASRVKLRPEVTNSATSRMNHPRSLEAASRSAQPEPYPVNAPIDND